MNTPEGSAPYAGIKVIDFGHHIAGPLAAMLLADQGAEVIHVDRPGYRAAEQSLDAVLQRNKSRITINLKTESGAEQALSLIQQADVLIENFRPGVMDRIGLGPEICRLRNPGLIYLSLPGFSSTDAERAQIAAWEGVVGAATGIFTNISFGRELLGLPPVYTSLPLPSVYGAVHGAIAVAMTLIARIGSQRGDHIEVPLASAFLSAMGSNLLSYAEQPERYDRPVPRSFRERELPSLKARFSSKGRAGVREALEFAARLSPPMMSTYRCGDGRLLYVFAMDHRRMSLRLLRELGLEPRFRDRLVERDPYLPTSVPNNLSDVGTLGKELRDQMRVAMKEAFETGSAAAWEDRLNAAGIPCAVHRSTAEWLREPHLLASGMGVKVVDPILGAMTQPGPAVWLDDNPSSLLSPRPRVMRPAATRFLSEASVESEADGQRRSDQTDQEGCLAGMRVLDLTTMIAGPACGRTLAEYGAEVIKIDSVAPHLGPRMTIFYGTELNSGKRSILLDLKKPEGREAFLRLVESADVVLHNMRPGVMKRLGLGLDVLRKRKPDIIECALTAFDGPRPGPWLSRPAYDPVVQCATGITTRYGSVESPEMHATASTIDYLTGFLAAFGTATALFRRAVPQASSTTVRASLAQSAMLAQLPFSFDHENRTWTGPSGQQATGPSPRSRLYKALDQWIFIHFELSSLAALDRQPSLSGIAKAEELEEFLVDRIAKKPASVIVAEFQRAGAGAHEVVNLLALRERYEVPRMDFAAEFVKFRGSFAVLRDEHHPCGTTVHTVAPLHARPAERPLRLLPANEKHGHSTISVLQAVGFTLQDTESMQRENTIASQLSSPYLPN